MKTELFFFESDVQVEQQVEQPTRLVGYAMKFNVLSADRGGYRDVFRPGVFGDLAGQDIKAYRDHEQTDYLGRTGNNSLRLAIDPIGLRFSLDLPDTTVGRDTRVLVERRDLTGMSFGVIPDQFRWKDEPEGPIREHLRGQLVEISAVFNPAFPKTELALASLQKWRDEQADEWRDEQADENPTVVSQTPNRNRAARLLKIWSVTHR